jgi:formate/nitrite transporter FocA (FNT family)
MGAKTYTPRETTELVSRAGVSKANMRIDKVFMSSVNAGMILSFACATHLSIQSSPWFQENAAGLIRAIGALVFPYGMYLHHSLATETNLWISGLTIIILTGSDLCTGSFMYTTLSFVHRRLSIWKMLLHWAVTFFGNLAGSLFVVAIITGCMAPQIV